MIADRLFLQVNDIESSQIKSLLNFDNLLDDDFLMSDGQEFLVFGVLSGRSGIDIREHYDLEKSFPILLSYTGKEYSGYVEIYDYLINNDVLLNV